MTSLNPVLTIGLQIIEPLNIHLGMTDAQARARAVELLQLVGIPDAERPARAVSASVLRRHAPARDDRDRPCLQSEAHHRRRADHRARRHHPGADPRADEEPVAQAQHRADHHHAQSRRGGALCRPRDRDVRGAHRRAGCGRRTYSTGRVIPTRWACCARCRGSTGRAAPSWRPSRDCRPISRTPPPGCRFAPRCPFRIECATQEPPLYPTDTGGVSRCHRHAEIAAGKIAWAASRAGTQQTVAQKRRADARRSVA